MPSKCPRPPRFPEFVMRFFYPKRESAYLDGDLQEIYTDVYEQRGRTAAAFWYWAQLLLTVPPLVIHSLYWSMVMLKNYLKTAFRQLFRQKVYAAINIAGLAVGLSCCILIFLYVADELSYDNFHKNEKTVFRILSQFHAPDGSIRSRGPALPAAMGEPLKDYFPEIQRVVRLAESRAVVRRNQVMDQERIYFTDPGIFQVFSFPLIKGDPETVLSQRQAIVLTETAAAKYFGNEDPVGKALTLTFGQNVQDFIVTGVAKNPPRNSTIQFRFLIPISNMPSLEYEEVLTNLGDFSTPLYIQVKPGVDAHILSDRFPAFVRQTFADEFTKWHKEGELKGDHIPVSLELQRLKDMHLDPDSWDGSSARNSYILAGIALVVLIIACMNFMNLSIGRAASRGKEIGMRKVIGAMRRQLVAQLGSETLLTFMLAFLAGVALAALFLPTFNRLAQKSLLLGDFIKAGHLSLLMLLMVIVSGLSASYPALVMSEIQPAQILKAKLGIGNRRTLARILVVVQFTLSIFLIISTLVLGRQIRYMTARNPGYVKEGLVAVSLQERVAEDSQKLVDLFRPKALSYPDVLQAGAMTASFGKGWSRYPLDKNGQRLHVFQYRVDEGFLPTLGIKLLQGRNFSREYASDSEAAIVNQEFLKSLEIADPIGHRIGEFVEGPADKYPYNLTIIGVMENFHVQSMQHELAPVMLHMQPGWGMSSLLVRISGGSVSDTIHRLEQIWKEVQPDKPFLYTFVEDDLEAQYNNEKRWSAIVRFSSLFAIVLACMGIFGLTSLAVNRRIKEIGIRKVLGASISQIFSLVTKEFLLLVGAANVIIWPVSYYVMHKILGTYYYRITLGPDVFLIAAGLSLAVSLATVSYLAVKASLSDPVKAIRYE
jgi:putative ABC transport system permease protein